MMLKLTTMNLKGFLTELAACCGGVTAEIAGAHHKNTDRVPALKLAGRPCLCFFGVCASGGNVHGVVTIP